MGNAWVPTARVYSERIRPLSYSILKRDATSLVNPLDPWFGFGGALPPRAASRIDPWYQSRSAGPCERILVRSAL